jgi:hypothetical protein
MKNENDQNDRKEKATESYTKKRDKNTNDELKKRAGDRFPSSLSSSERGRWEKK